MTDLNRIMQIDAVLRKLPLEFALRWCEPGEGGCYCMGCANSSEIGSGDLVYKGFTKADWEAWKQWRLTQ